LHNKNNSTLIKANFFKTANFLGDLKGGIFNILKVDLKKVPLAEVFISRFLTQF